MLKGGYEDRTGKKPAKKLTPSQQQPKITREIEIAKRTRDAYTKDMAISDRDDNKFDTKSGPFERMMKGSAARKAQSRINDLSKVAGRVGTIESRSARTVRSAKYRAAQAALAKRKGKK
jgi:hypothetical protein